MANYRKSIPIIVFFLSFLGIHQRLSSQDLIKLSGGKMYKQKVNYITYTKNNKTYKEYKNVGEKTPYGNNVEVTYDEFFKKGVISFANAQGKIVKIPFKELVNDIGIKYHACKVEGVNYTLILFFVEILKMRGEHQFFLSSEHINLKSGYDFIISDLQSK